MNDTTLEMQSFQYNLIMNKTDIERFTMGLEMMETGREMMIAGIKSENPDFNLEQIRLELLYRQKLHDKSLFWLDFVVKEFQK